MLKTKELCNEDEREKSIARTYVGRARGICMGARVNIHGEQKRIRRAEYLEVEEKMNCRKMSRAEDRGTEVTGPINPQKF